MKKSETKNMGMLDRYKKTGGFIQLITLLDTCGLQKRDKFLEIIRQEDSRWARVLEAKLIDLNRVLSWSDAALAEVTGVLQEINVVAICTTLDESQRARLIATLPHQRRRKVEELLENARPTPGEVSTSINKLVEAVRKLAAEGVLRFDKIDPQLHIDSDIEERLAQGRPIAGIDDHEIVHVETSVGQSGSGETEDSHLAVVRSLDTFKPSTPTPIDTSDQKALAQEVEKLRKRVNELERANVTLKNELAIAKTKLEQIRRIA
ncbi:MAG TPA: FliG C-terminal domain-containing protein [Pseudobdellovibrionaceae bacterium]|nr:FliG C-terminal domain-containing protein [Pseudobdellovibrionaceae bacterium]